MLYESILSPRLGEIWAFVRNIRAILKGSKPHEANLKSDECLALWPHEPHDASHSTLSAPVLEHQASD